MCNRSIINDKIVDWIKNRVATKYPDDISMVLLYGSYINGTVNSQSDVDCYFIPRTEHGYQMAVDYIIADTGYDIFPMSWERVERISELKEVLLPCVGDVRILYAHSDEDLDRFRHLQNNLRKNLKDENYIKKIIMEMFTRSGSIYAKMQTSTNIIEVMKCAGSVIMVLSNVIALYNHDYFHCGLKKQLEDLQNKFVHMPEDFITTYVSIIRSVNKEQYIEHSFKLLSLVGNYLGLKPPIIKNEPVIIPKEKPGKKMNPDYNQLAALYEEISSTFNKIYNCCENGDGTLVFLSAVSLQGDLDEAVELGGRAYELLNHYKYTELTSLSKKVKDIELDLVQYITAGGGRIKKYNSFEEFDMADL